MPGYCRIAIPLAALLLSSVAIADDAAVPAVRGAQWAAASLSVQALLKQSGYGTRWQVTYDVALRDDDPASTLGAATVDFRDSSALSRVSRVRSLSLLTLAEVGRTHVFIGVDDDGMVGLHFKAFDRRSRERHLELLRMSYLEEDPVPLFTQ